MGGKPSTGTPKDKRLGENRAPGSNPEKTGGRKGLAPAPWPKKGK